jgi:hypothetical protein
MVNIDKVDDPQLAGLLSGRQDDADEDIYLDKHAKGMLGKGAISVWSIISTPLCCEPSITNRIQSL